MGEQAPVILVVDDSADGRLMYSMYLSHHGFRVLEAGDGEAAIQLAIEHRPMLILMDLGLPKMDGWEATRRIKADPRTRHILVFALSGHAFPDSIERAEQAGVDVFLRKPVTPALVLARVRELLRGTTAES